MRLRLPLLLLIGLLGACEAEAPFALQGDGADPGEVGLTPDGPAPDAADPHPRRPDLALPDGGVILDAAPPPPTCADDDADGDGYGVGPLCAAPDCDDGNAAIHPGAVEACNGLDDDCDGIVDEDLYTARCGVGACRREVENCVEGAVNVCVPGAPAPEACNGLDDDCDGAVDEDAGDLICGVGACARAGACGPDGPVCEPGPPAPETCNGVDDDCDGAVDEGLGGATLEARSYAQQLGPRHPGCDGYGQRIGPECNAAIHRHCAAQACRDTGFGPVENSGDDLQLTCLGGVRVVDVGFDALQARHPGCGADRPRVSPDCNAAIHRWCGAEGSVSGFGPLEHGATMRVACVGADRGQVFETSYSRDLAARHGPCDGVGQRMGPDCNAAIHRWCRAQGFESGFGPIENSGDRGFVVCVR